LNQVALQ